jgi:hypothetical protein
VASILNNIIAYNTGLGAMDAGLGTAEYNLFYENSEGPSPQFLSDTNLVDVDPAFVAWSADGLCNDDLTLGPGSPAIDGGDPALSDIDGTRSDIGATGGPYGNTPDVAEPTDPTDTGPSDPDTTPESDSTGRSRPSIPAGWFCSATGSLPSSFLVFLAFFAVIRRQR